MAKIEVYVTYKDSILDPQGQAVQKAAAKLGFDQISGVRIGKYFEIEVTGDVASAQEQVEKLSNELLANPNMETYRVEVSE
ncbi:phosphoribosylformylglycinamidine synthase subunit PurS [Lactococcus termiticola]|uniref:Phosphoribosylformylglycinamidine synthase subunit PurS n=1 Tax=Lactococcus termiticola TaxID=2169526 RepID=A0A2R5HDN0_9LACT|nr:phosphoribosylformylglycinamidine synthase subunit PurS [Lactococcus termiticola]GBG96194.1 phosphoribosylformylglycinamidine synthase [Lactococcus termiticola]